MASDPLTEARFWAQVMADSARTVYCPPEWESRCKGYVDARGLGGLIKVVANPWVPDNQIVVVDDNAMEASWRQSLQAIAREPLYPTGFAYTSRLLCQDVIHHGLGWWQRTPPLAKTDFPLDRWEDDGGACR